MYDGVLNYSILYRIAFERGPLTTADASTAVAEVNSGTVTSAFEENFGHTN